MATTIPSKYGQEDWTFRLTSQAQGLQTIVAHKDGKSYRLLYNDKDLGQRSLYYSSNQRSPFADEHQGHILEEPLIFEKGFLLVPKEKKVLQWFLDITPDNGKIFTRIDTAKDAEAELRKLEMQDEASSYAAKVSDDKVDEYIRLIKGRVDSKLKPSEKKLMIRKFALAEPKKFLEMVKDPEMSARSDVRKYFEKNILKKIDSNVVMILEEGEKPTTLLTLPKGVRDAKMFEIVEEFLLHKDNIDTLTHLGFALELKTESKS